MKSKKIKIAISAKRVNGKTTFEYADVSAAKYEAWLKQCYELSGN